MFKEKISKLIFYKFKGNNDEESIIMPEEKEEYNSALNNVIEKDIIRLARRLNDMIKTLQEQMNKENIFYNKTISSDINNIEDIIEDIKNIKKILIKEKRKSKPKILSFNRKKKKQKYNNILELLSCVERYQNNIISIKEEYNKLNSKLDISYKRKEEIKTEDDSDMLERTISFYMNKSE